MQVAPILDEAINVLGAEDRKAILLRFFEQRDFRSVGEALGSNEDAARMRVNRALEKLHTLLKHRGVTLSAAALGTVLAAGAVTAAPAGLAFTISSVALAGAAAGTGTTLALLKIMTMTNLKLGIGALVVVGVTTALVVQHQAQIKLRGDNQSLRQQIGQLTTERERLARPAPVPRLPAPPVPMATQTNASPAATLVQEDLQFTNLYSRFTNAEPKLTAAQVEAYLKANRTNAASLLAAYRTSGDKALLKEAMEKYPNDPQVALEAIFDKDLSPEQQRQWLNTFEKSAPDNALANYLSAYNYFNSGQIDQGIQELIADPFAGGRDEFLNSLVYLPGIKVIVCRKIIGQRIVRRGLARRYSTIGAVLRGTNPCRNSPPTLLAGRWDIFPSLPSTVLCRRWCDRPRAVWPHWSGWL